ncbi:MAG TPA: hypothetical protein VIJ94_17915 [Caulobacteraceae bacterium]
MSETTLAIFPDEASPPTLSVDDAVRAALLGRPLESRSFGNEDDVEGPRGLPSSEEFTASPAP